MQKWMLSGDSLFDRKKSHSWSLKLLLHWAPVTTAWKKLRKSRTFCLKISRRMPRLMRLRTRIMWRTSFTAVGTFTLWSSQTSKGREVETVLGLAMKVWKRIRSLHLTIENPEKSKQNKQKQPQNTCHRQIREHRCGNRKMQIPSQIPSLCWFYYDRENLACARLI